MRVYRIEAPDGQGPWQTSHVYPEVVRRIDKYYDFCEYPAKSIDFPECSDIQEHEVICCVHEKRLILHWFTAEQIKTMVKHGLRIRYYDVEPNEVVIGLSGKQCFIPFQHDQYRKAQERRCNKFEPIEPPSLEVLYEAFDEMNQLDDLMDAFRYSLMMNTPRIQSEIPKGRVKQIQQLQSGCGKTKVFIPPDCKF